MRLVGEGRVDEPSSRQLADALDRLDGREHTMLVLEGRQASLRVTGGAPYLVVQFLRGEDEWVLVGDPDAEGEETLVLDGVRRTILRRVCVGRRYAGQVAEHFRRKEWRRLGARWERVVMDL